VTKSLAQKLQEQNPGTRKAVQCVVGFTVVAALAVLAAAAVYAQDKYSLQSPSGIAFSDFREYEDWAVVSSARTEQILKVIVANPITVRIGDVEANLAVLFLRLGDELGSSTFP
jgi:hypothetical protein